MDYLFGLYPIRPFLPKDEISVQLINERFIDNSFILQYQPLIHILGFSRFEYLYRY